MLADPEMAAGELATVPRELKSGVESTFEYGYYAATGDARGESLSSVERHFYAGRFVGNIVTMAFPGFGRGKMRAAFAPAARAIPSSSAAGAARQSIGKAVDVVGPITEPTYRAANDLSAPRLPDGSAYSVIAEFTLNAADIPKGRSSHTRLANSALASELAINPAYASFMEQHIPGISAAVNSHANPPGFVWHHHANTVGLMQLVPYSQHRKGSIFQNTLHPNGVGGYANWAIPAGAPPN